MSEQLTIDEDRPRFSGQRLVIIFIIVFVSAAAVSYPIWMSFNQTVQSQNSQIKILEERTESLNEQINNI